VPTTKSNGALIEGPSLENQNSLALGQRNGGRYRQKIGFGAGVREANLFDIRITIDHQRG
jgi:hypothetical protein